MILITLIVLTIIILIISPILHYHILRNKNYYILSQSEITDFLIDYELFAYSSIVLIWLMVLLLMAFLPYGGGDLVSSTSESVSPIYYDGNHIFLINYDGDDMTILDYSEDTPIVELDYYKKDSSYRTSTPKKITLTQTGEPTITKKVFAATPIIKYLCWPIDMSSVVYEFTGVQYVYSAPLKE